jgi:hypothetical protein
MPVDDDEFMVGTGTFEDDEYGDELDELTEKPDVGTGDNEDDDVDVGTITDEEDEETAVVAGAVAVATHNGARVVVSN